VEFSYCLFYGAFSILHYTEASAKTIKESLNSKDLEGSVSRFQGVFRHLPAGAEENHQIFS
jgi:hypothetical protein